MEIILHKDYDPFFISLNIMRSIKHNKDSFELNLQFLYEDALFVGCNSFYGICTKTYNLHYATFDIASLDDSATRKINVKVFCFNEFLKPFGKDTQHDINFKKSLFYNNGYLMCRASHKSINRIYVLDSNQRSKIYTLPNEVSVDKNVVHKIFFAEGIIIVGCNIDYFTNTGKNKRLLKNVQNACYKNGRIIALCEQMNIINHLKLVDMTTFKISRLELSEPIPRYYGCVNDVYIVGSFIAIEFVTCVFIYSVDYEKLKCHLVTGLNTYSKVGINMTANKLMYANLNGELYKYDLKNKTSEMYDFDFELLGMINRFNIDQNKFYTYAYYRPMLKIYVKNLFENAYQLLSYFKPEESLFGSWLHSNRVDLNLIKLILSYIV